MKILNSLYFTNHLNKKIKLDNNLIEYELINEEKKLYASLSFITQDIYYKPEIISDLIDRIEYKFKVDDKDEKSIFFVIDSIDYLRDNKIKVFCKTKGIKYSKKYSGTLNKVVKTDSLKNLLNMLLDEINLDNLSDVPFYFDYEIKDKSIEETIIDLSKIFGFDYYFKEGIIYFEDKKVIKKYDESVARFSEISDIISFSTSTNKDDKKINKIYINKKEKIVITAEPQIILDINNSPQCCSPNEVKTFTDDDGSIYKISPVNAYYVIYYSPLLKKPITNLDTQEGERIVVEEFELNNDEFVTLTGGIKEIIGVDGVENYSFKENYNILTFDKTSGTLKVSYKTDVLVGSIPHSEYPKSVPIEIKHFNQILEYNHKIELNGYYPIPYNFTLNLIKDWGIDYNNALNKDVTIYKKNGDVFDEIGTFTSNAFGEISFNIDEYNTYKFTTENYDDLYLDWFINRKSIKMDEIKE